MFPGLAVAAELRRRGHRVAVILSGRAVEADRAKADLPEGTEAMLVPVDPVSPRRPKSLFKLWRAHDEEYAQRLEKHIGRHLELLYGGFAK